MLVEDQDLLHLLLHFLCLVVVGVFDYVINIIKAARPAASINPGFEAQLRAYAQTNYDVYAAQQVLLQSRLRALKQLRVF